jgi:hypothetical protein
VMFYPPNKLCYKADSFISGIVVCCTFLEVMITVLLLTCFLNTWEHDMD